MSSLNLKRKARSRHPVECAPPTCAREQSFRTLPETKKPTTRHKVQKFTQLGLSKPRGRIACSNRMRLSEEFIRNMTSKSDLDEHQTSPCCLGRCCLRSLRPAKSSNLFIVDGGACAQANTRSGASLFDTKALLDPYDSLISLTRNHPHAQSPLWISVINDWK